MSQVATASPVSRTKGISRRQLNQLRWQAKLCKTIYLFEQTGFIMMISYDSISKWRQKMETLSLLLPLYEQIIK